MKHEVKKLIQTFEREGLKNRASRFFARYPESPEHLTHAELREQVTFYADVAGQEKTQQPT
jgi:hypothetical protein